MMVNCVGVTDPASVKYSCRFLSTRIQQKYNSKIIYGTRSKATHMISWERENGDATFSVDRFG